LKTRILIEVLNTDYENPAAFDIFEFPNRGCSVGENFLMWTNFELVDDSQIVFN
jgi:hypothetical protein